MLSPRGGGIVAGAATGAWVLLGSSRGVTPITTGHTDYAPILIGGVISGLFALAVAIVTVFGREIADKVLHRETVVKVDPKDALESALADEHAENVKLREQLAENGIEVGDDA